MITDQIEHFFKNVAKGEIEIYNEFSLQHELGIFLRTRRTRQQLKIQFERPVGFFGLNGKYLKTEIDLTIFEAPDVARFAIELKFPRNGQYPEQMFKFCQDVAFIEQLVGDGFDGGCFVVVADDARFWSGREQTGIYAHFRASSPIHGRIAKPTGKDKGDAFDVLGSYPVIWHQADWLRYALVTVGSAYEV